MREDVGNLGGEELRRALAELLDIGWQSIVAYRAAAQTVTHARVEAALTRLCLDHERHVHELEAFLRSPADAGRSVLLAGGRDVGPTQLGNDAPQPSADQPAPIRIAEVTGVWHEVRRQAGGGAILDALRRAEKELESVYASHVSRSHVEPVGTMLRRHHREEQAHVKWLQESELWRGLGQGEPVRTAAFPSTGTDSGAPDGPHGNERLRGPTGFAQDNHAPQS